MTRPSFHPQVYYVKMTTDNRCATAKRGAFLARNVGGKCSWTFVDKILFSIFIVSNSNIYCVRLRTIIMNIHKALLSFY